MEHAKVVNLFKLPVSVIQSLSLEISEEIVLLTPDEINRFISQLKTKYGTKSKKHLGRAK